MYEYLTKGDRLEDLDVNVALRDRMRQGLDPTELLKSHCFLSNKTFLTNTYGGEIIGKGDIYRTDEMSGHYGQRWHDKIRVLFISLMHTRGL